MNQWHRLTLVVILSLVSACGPTMRAQRNASSDLASTSETLGVANIATENQVVLVRYFQAAFLTHFTDLNPFWFSSSAYPADGPLTVASRVAQPGLHAVYECVVNLDAAPLTGQPGHKYFTSVDPNCEGAQRFMMRDPVYLSDQPASGMARPLYRCYNDGLLDHLDTMQPEVECTGAAGNGYRPEFILGFGT